MIFVPTACHGADAQDSFGVALHCREFSRLVMARKPSCATHGLFKFRAACAYPHGPTASANRRPDAFAARSPNLAHKNLRDILRRRFRQRLFWRRARQDRV
eukprot:5663481-Amphidinium_carterae.1